MSPSIRMSRISFDPTASALPVLKVGVSSPDSPSVLEYPRVFLDSGAQRTFSSPKLKAKLKLPVVGEFVGSVESFNQCESPKSYSVVALNLHLGETLTSIYAIVSQDVGRPMFMCGYARAVQFLSRKGFRMADSQPSDCIQDIQLILGVDYLPLLFKRKTQYLGLQLVETPVGHVVW